MPATTLTAKLIPLALAALATAAHAQILFTDDFSGSSLDTSKWSLGTWQLGRTQLAFSPAVAGGVASLRHDTYNPSDPGGTFRGTEIYTKQSFARGTAGLELEARVRTRAGTPSGLVTSFFTYTFNPNNTSDEIDFEFLTKQINADNVAGSSGHHVQLTTWNDWDNAHPNRTTTANVLVPSLNLAAFNTFTIRWLPTHIEWLINGTLVRSSPANNPDAPTPVRLNFWASDPGWSAAYDGSLQPTGSAAANASAFYDVDYVTVRVAPEPTTVTLLACGLTPLLLSRRARRQ